MAATAARLYNVAKRWDAATYEERSTVKELVSRLVGYPCKIACEMKEEGRVEMFVLSNQTDDIEDVLEIQESGAIGLIYDQYDDPDSKRVVKVDNRCESYNDGLGLVFEEHSDSESESESSSDSEEAEEKEKEKDE